MVLDVVNMGWLIKVFFAMVNFVHMMCTKSSVHLLCISLLPDCQNIVRIHIIMLFCPYHHIY